MPSPKPMGNTGVTLQRAVSASMLPSTSPLGGGILTPLPGGYSTLAGVATPLPEPLPMPLPSPTTSAPLASPTVASPASPLLSPLASVRREHLAMPNCPGPSELELKRAMKPITQKRTVEVEIPELVVCTRKMRYDVDEIVGWETG